MVSDDSSPLSLSRRRLLGLLGGGGVLAGIGWFAPTWLPDPVTDTLTTSYPNPPSNYLWQPPVSDEHADEAVAKLETTVERAEELKSQIDLDAVPEGIRYGVRGSPSGGHLDSARQKRNNRKRLYSATSGLLYAGESVAAAKFVLDEIDPEAVVERGRRLRERADDVAASIADYRVSDIGRGLGFCYEIERQVLFARLDSHGGSYVGKTADADDYDAHAIVSTWGEQLQAEQRLRNARRFRTQYLDHLGDDATVQRDHLLDVLDTFLSEIESYPTRSEMRTRIEDEGLTRETPYGYGRWILWQLCYDNDYDDFDGELGGDLLVRRVVKAGRGMLKRRAYDFALGELDIGPGDTDYDSGRSFRAKRQAMEEFQSARDGYDSNFACVVANEAARLIRGGDVGLMIGDGPAWQERLNSTLYSLVGGGMMQNLGDVVEAVEEV